MCGRAYHTYTEEELYLRYLNERAKQAPLGIRPHFNLAPTQLTPVVFVRDGSRRIELFRWGLVPFWAKDVKSTLKYSLINAKAEEVDQKRSYQGAFRARRCIVPVTGFFEWKRPSSDTELKKPFAIHASDHSILSLAGVWEHWTDPNPLDPAQREIFSFSILTTEANALMKPIHHRMPVILDPEVEYDWLNPKLGGTKEDTKRLLSLLKPCPAERLKAYEISPLVNSPKNNVSEVLRPVKEQ